MNNSLETFFLQYCSVSPQVMPLELQYIFFYQQVALAKIQQWDNLIFESTCHLSTSLHLQCWFVLSLFTVCLNVNQIKLNLSLYSLYYVERARTTPLPLKNVAAVASRSAVGNTVSDLTGPRFEPLTSRSRDERISARATI